ncbi:Uncharacterised protein [uncultured archaeon]|nr:Uncharacterised protein [uncultured archaeon]
MPPHCDTMDGPVVTAAKNALETGNVKLILPWAPKSAEAEIKKAYDKTLVARKLGKEAKEVADLWFFETVVRLHRTGEGAPYTGLKPSGLDEGPVVPKVEEAIEKGDVKDVIKLLNRAVEEKVTEKFRDTMSKRRYDPNDVDSAREYVESFLGLTLYSPHLYEFIKAGGHPNEGEGGPKHGG